PEHAEVPGFVDELRAFGETTVIVEAPLLVEAATYLRDEGGFNFLADISAADYLGWGEHGVAGYVGTAAGRDINRPMTQGLERLPAAKPKRFSVSYHLLAIGPTPRRLRLQVWLDEDEPVPSVI